MIQLSSLKMREHSSVGKSVSVPKIPEVLSVQGALGGNAHDHFSRAKCSGKKESITEEEICLYKEQTKHIASEAGETVSRHLVLLV